MCRNSVLRMIFGPTRDEVMGEWGIRHNETLYEMGGACSTYEEEERCMQDLDGET